MFDRIFFAFFKLLEVILWILLLAGTFMAASWVKAEPVVGKERHRICSQIAGVSMAVIQRRDNGQNLNEIAQSLNSFMKERGISRNLRGTWLRYIIHVYRIEDKTALQVYHSEYTQCMGDRT